MPIEIETALIGVIASLIGGWFGAAISRKSAIDILTKEQFLVAASKFKSSILYELTGSYPVIKGWSENDFKTIVNSIPIINRAAAEFRYFVIKKSDFDKSIAEYNKYCYETTYNSLAVDVLYPNTKEGKKTRKQEEFKDIVEHLISFAN